MSKRSQERKLTFLEETQNMVLFPCDICGGSFNATMLPNNEYMGYKYCAWCSTRNAIQQIRCRVLVEKLAKRKCRRMQIELFPEDYVNWNPCGKCLECNAKKIMGLWKEPEHKEQAINQKLLNLNVDSSRSVRYN